MLPCLAIVSPPPSLKTQNVAIRKVKVLKAPKFDLTKLMDVHGDYTEEVREGEGTGSDLPQQQRDEQKQ
jgi:small subunit ribosomal protein S3Ae